jgi:hypothetical protein
LALAWTFRRHGARVPLVLGGIAFAVLAPWLVRSWIVLGAPAFVTTTGEHFFLGNVPPSRGGNLLPSGDPVLSAAPPALLGRLFAADERGQGSVFWEAGLAYAREQPGAFARGVARKLLHFWTWAEQTGVTYPPLYRTAYLGCYLILLLVAAIGAFTLARGAREQRDALLLTAALFLSVSAVHALLYVELRHRFALEPLLAVLAGVACRRPKG